MLEERPKRLLTFETFHQSDEETWPDLQTLPDAQRTQGIKSLTWIIFLTEINLIYEPELGVMDWNHEQVRPLQEEINTCQQGLLSVSDLKYFLESDINMHYLICCKNLVTGWGWYQLNWYQSWPPGMPYWPYQLVLVCIFISQSHISLVSQTSVYGLETLGPIDQTWVSFMGDAISELCELVFWTAIALSCQIGNTFIFLVLSLAK